MRIVSKIAFTHLLALLCALSLLPGMSAAGDAAAPQQVIEKISSQLKETIDRERERLQTDPGFVYQLAEEILLPHVDFARVSGLVLGKYWRRATPRQKRNFSREFKRLLVRTYATAFHEFGDWEIRYLPVRLSKSGKDATVRTQVLRPEAAEPVEVIYRMHLKDGQWMAYDVKIEGISLITNYRSTFSKEVRRLGMDGLIKKIASLNDTREGVKSLGAAELAGNTR